MIWSGSEEHQRFGVSLGHLYGVGSRAQTATFSLLQGRKEASHDVNSHQCLRWEERGREGGRERERESERSSAPYPGPGSSVPWWGSVHQAPWRVV